MTRTKREREKGISPRRLRALLGGLMKKVALTRVRRYSRTLPRSHIKTRATCASNASERLTWSRPSLRSIPGNGTSPSLAGTGRAVDSLGHLRRSSWSDRQRGYSRISPNHPRGRKRTHSGDPTDDRGSLMNARGGRMQRKSRRTRLSS